MKNIYLLFSCDAWKSKSSYSLIMVSTSKNKIRREINRQVKAGLMSIEDKVTKKDDPEDINRVLEYGHIIITKDGERQWT